MSEVRKYDNYAVRALVFEEEGWVFMYQDFFSLTSAIKPEYNGMYVFPKAIIYVREKSKFDPWN
jgi:hypothetical protein